VCAFLFPSRVSFAPAPAVSKAGDRRGATHRRADFLRGPSPLRPPPFVSTPPPRKPKLQGVQRRPPFNWSRAAKTPSLFTFSPCCPPVHSDVMSGVVLSPPPQIFFFSLTLAVYSASFFHPLVDWQCDGLVQLPCYTPNLRLSFVPTFSGSPPPRVNHPPRSVVARPSYLLFLTLVPTVSQFPSFSCSRTLVFLSVSLMNQLSLPLPHVV